MDDVFRRPLADYKVYLSPSKQYIKQATNYISKRTGCDIATARKKLKQIIKSSDVKNPQVTYRVRKDNGDRVESKSTLTEYLAETLSKDQIMVPSLTTYDQPKARKSIHGEFMTSNIKLRNIDKKKAHAAYQMKDMVKANHYNVLQGIRKIFNNSLSGTYASKSTLFCNKSAHYTLTSLTRCVASIGNAVTESIVAGNKHFRTPDTVYNYITAVISTVNLPNVHTAIKRLGLVVPSPQDVLAMIKYSSDLYWESDAVDKDVLDYLSKLTDAELASVMYVNDLYHLKKHNEVFVKTLLDNLSKRVTTGCGNPLNTLSSATYGVKNLTHHICMEDIRGKDIKYNELKGTDLLMTLGSTAKNIQDTLQKYRLLFKAFFTTDVLPIGIAHVKSMYRDSIVLSDTDSTCGAYDMWVDWRYGGEKFSPKTVALAAAVMTINTEAIDHNIKVFAKNNNVPIDHMDVLIMKNEYFWSVFCAANVSKHYFANTIIREGSVFNNPSMVLKGAHLIASSIDKDIVGAAHDLMGEVLHAAENNIELDPHELLTRVADYERSILDSLSKGELTFLKLDKVKPFKAYKSDVVGATPYFHHLLWMKCFADDYGNPGEPEYMMLKIPTTLETKKSLTTFISNIEDVSLRDNLQSIISEHKKTVLGTFRVPLVIATGNKCPQVLLDALDSKRVVRDNMNIFYLVLETLGVFRKDGLLFSEMGY